MFEHPSLLHIYSFYYVYFFRSKLFSSLFYTRFDSIPNSQDSRAFISTYYPLGTHKQQNTIMFFSPTPLFSISILVTHHQTPSSPISPLLYVSPLSCLLSFAFVSVTPFRSMYVCTYIPSPQLFISVLSFFFFDYIAISSNVGSFLNSSSFLLESPFFFFLVVLFVCFLFKS